MMFDEHYSVVHKEKIKVSNVRLITKAAETLLTSPSRRLIALPRLELLENSDYNSGCFFLGLELLNAFDSFRVRISLRYGQSSDPNGLMKVIGHRTVVCTLARPGPKYSSEITAAINQSKVIEISSSLKSQIEGVGIGTALAGLTDNLVVYAYRSFSPMNSAEIIFHVVVDSAKGLDSNIDRAGWTTNTFSAEGYQQGSTKIDRYWSPEHIDGGSNPGVGREFISLKVWRDSEEGIDLFNLE